MFDPFGNAQAGDSARILDTEYEGSRNVGGFVGYKNGLLDANAVQLIRTERH